MVGDAKAFEDRPVETDPMPALALGALGRLGVEQEGVGRLEVSLELNLLVLVLGNWATILVGGAYAPLPRVSRHGALLQPKQETKAHSKLAGR